MENKRISVFSFAKDLMLADFIFFLVVVVSYATVTAQHELAAGRENSVETLITIVGHISTFIPVAVVLTIIFEIGGFLIMILWRLYQQKLEAYLEQVKVEARVEARAEGQAEGRVEGQVENHQLWDSWNNRRIEAESQNRPFNEPPPPPPSASS